MQLIDVRDGPHGRGAKGRCRWYPERQNRKATGVCFHHTAVHGGFGTHRSVRSQFLGTPEEVRALALGHRYRGMPELLNKRGAQPYHAIWNEHVQTLYYVHPFERVTWHGNGANKRFLGFAWDERSKEVRDRFDVSGAQDAARRFVLDARAEGHPIEEFTCHSAWTNKPHDPGADFIDLVISPVADELDIFIDWDFTDPSKKRAKSMAEVLKGATP